MEWREQSAVSCEEAYLEAQRWIEVSKTLKTIFTFTDRTLALGIIHKVTKR